MQIKTYIINLESATQRKENLQKQILSLPILDTIFVNAISGKDINYNGVAHLGYNSSMRKKLFEEDLTLNEIACFLSHRKVLDDFLLTTEPFCLVLEDDAIFSDQFPKILPLLLNNCKGWDLIDLEPRKKTMIGHHIERLASSYSLFVPKTIAEGATALLYSRNGAKKIRNTMNIFFYNYDIHLLHAHWKNDLHLAQIFPALITESNVESTIADRVINRDIRKTRTLSSILRKLVNSFQKRTHLYSTKTKITIELQGPP